jgi:hypothetical protein
VVCEGEDCPDVAKFQSLMANPETHDMFGHSFRWETKRSMVPKGLNTEEFDEWLWETRLVREPSNM